MYITFHIFLSMMAEISCSVAIFIRNIVTVVTRSVYIFYSVLMLRRPKHSSEFITAFYWYSQFYFFIHNM